MCLHAYSKWLLGVICAGLPPHTVPQMSRFRVKREAVERGLINLARLPLATASV